MLLTLMGMGKESTMVWELTSSVPSPNINCKYGVVPFIDAVSVINWCMVGELVTCITKQQDTIHTFIFGML